MLKPLKVETTTLKHQFNCEKTDMFYYRHCIYVSIDLFSTVCLYFILLLYVSCLK